MTGYKLTVLREAPNACEVTYSTRTMLTLDNNTLNNTEIKY